MNARLLPLAAQPLKRCPRISNEWLELGIGVFP
jgi:hypothetical protein